MQRRYKGSSGGIGILIPVLIVLCIVAAGVLYFLNDNMTYTREGTQITFAKDEQPIIREDAEIVIEGVEETPPIEITPAEETVSATVATDFKSVFVPIEKVIDAKAFESVLLAMPEGTDTVVLEVKAEDGRLAFASDSTIAKNAEVSGNDETFETVLNLAKESGYNVAFYMSCFKDNESARTNPAIAARTENKMMWRDAGDIRWISAYSDEGKAYLLSLITKLSGYKPCEIILSNISFPAVGRPEIIFYDTTSGTKQEMLKGFITSAKETAGNIALSAVYENYNSRRIEHSGQNPEDYKVFGNIYVRGVNDQYTLPFENARMLFEGSDCDVVPMGKDVSGEEFMIK